MRKTYAIVELDLIDITAKADSSISAETEFSDISGLCDDGDAPPNYGTLEWNNFVLDGTKEEFPDVDISGYISAVSADDCTFSSNPIVEVSFTSYHSSAGITLYFWGNYPRKIKLTYYRDEKKISSKDFIVDNYIFFADSRTENYTKVIVEFVETWNPYERVKLYRIDYGTYFKWDRSNVMAAKIIEEVDPISSQLSINTADLTIYDKSTYFNMMNPSGLYRFLQESQQIHITEFVNDVPIPMGSFYLDKSESKKETQISFSCIDALGILDKTTFFKGRIYNGDTAEQVISEIMTSAGWRKYTIEDELKNIPVYGYIPVCTHREALQQVIFVLGAVADCSRSEDINIYRVKKTVTSYIGKNRKISDQSKYQLRDFVSDIEITIHSYAKGTEEEELFNGNLPAGLTQLTFEGPVEVVSSTAEIVETGTNYVILSASTAGEYVISGYSYSDTAAIYTKTASDIPANQTRNAVQVSNATLVTSDNAEEIASRLLEYYSMRNQTEAKIILDSEKTGDWTAITGLFNQKYAGCLESQTIDLSSGFLATVKIVGFNKEMLAYYYTGELVSGDGIGVM